MKHKKYDICCFLYRFVFRLFNIIRTIHKQLYFLRCYHWLICSYNAVVTPKENIHTYHKGYNIAKFIMKYKSIYFSNLFLSIVPSVVAFKFKYVLMHSIACVKQFVFLIVIDCGQLGCCIWASLCSHMESKAHNYNKRTTKRTHSLNWEAFANYQPIKKLSNKRF